MFGFIGKRERIERRLAMDEKLWINKETDLIKKLEQKEYDFLVQYARDNQQNILMEWSTADATSVQKRIRLGRSILRYFESQLQSRVDMTAIFKLGELSGTVDSLGYLLSERKRDEWTEKIFKKEVLSIKHLDEIVLLLEVYGVMNHSEICQNLNLKESTLSEIMKKVDLTKLISASRVGKYKLYRLTDEGRRLGKQLRIQKNNPYGEQEILGQLQTILEGTEPNIEFRKRVQELLDDEVDYIKNSIVPGDYLTLYYKNYEEKERAEYKVLGITNGKENHLTIMAEKRKYDIEGISNIYHSNKEEEYA